MFGPRHRGRGRGHGFALGLLAMQVMQVGLNNIPPVTLVTMGAQVAIFLQLFKMPFTSISDVCVSAFHVYYREEWQRIFYAPFFHLSDVHLYFNMVSYMWKGRSLEPRMGSGYFLYLIAVFTVLTTVTHVGLAIVAERVFDEPSYITSCAAGFSGVLFALKVVTTYMMPPGVTYVMGFLPVHSRLACWAELALIQVMVPNASFIGHLSGILVGLLYVKGPLKAAMGIFVRPEPTYRYHVGSTGQRSGGRAASATQPGRRQATLNRFGGGMSEEEQVSEAVRRSQEQYYRDQYRESPRPTPTAPPQSELETEESPSTSRAAPGGQSRLYPDLNNSSSASTNRDLMSPEELRRRRLQRFDST